MSSNYNYIKQYVIGVRIKKKNKGKITDDIETSLYKYMNVLLLNLFDF